MFQTEFWKKTQPLFIQKRETEGTKKTTRSTMYKSNYIVSHYKISTLNIEEHYIRSSCSYSLSLDSPPSSFYLFRLILIIIIFSVILTLIHISSLQFFSLIYWCETSENRRFEGLCAHEGMRVLMKEFYITFIHQPIGLHTHTRVHITYFFFVYCLTYMQICL